MKKIPENRILKNEYLIELKNISKDFGEFRLKDLSFRVDEGDYFVLLGESGAGKSIILEIIAGLVQPDSGKVFFHGRDFTHERIQNRKFALLFQDYALFPHMRVRENILYPLKKSKLDKHQKLKKLLELADELNIRHLLKRRTTTLSGGEQQRVALARTLIMAPACLLLDEPLAALDVQLQIELRSLLRKINKRGMTIIHVTHDYEEAISLATRVGVIQDGTVIQTGTPMEVFQNPKNRFVAQLTGIKNFFPAKLVSNGGDSREAVINEDLSFEVMSGLEGGAGHVMISGKDIILSREKLASTASNNFRGKVTDVHPSRFGMEICVDIGIVLSVMISSRSFEAFNFQMDEEVWVSFKASTPKFYRS